jgi:DNA-directed RNA polymerase specialized sigma subunit
MIAIITGDIINSRKINKQDIWIKPLKELLRTWGRSPKQWEIFRGDFFQLELKDPAMALNAALRIKALIRSIDTSEGNKRISDLDVRMAIGIGSKDYGASRISESNGSAFVLSGEKFEKLKKEKLTLALNSPWKTFDKEINLYLKLACIQMDKWTISSGEFMEMLLRYPNKTQTEIGVILGIEQNSVSGRWSRANAQEIIEVEQMFKEKLKTLK